MDVKNDYIRKQNVMGTLLALECVVDGVTPFLEDEFKKFHIQLQSQMGHLSQPCTANIPCSKGSKDIQSWCYSCSSWLTAILSRHRNRAIIGRYGSDWSKIDSSRWPSDSTEVEKCFHPKWCSNINGPGPNIEDISVIIDKMLNCDDIRTHFFNTVDPGQIKDIRNKIHHETEITSDEKEKHCQLMMDFLKTPTVWKYSQANDAYRKIEIFKNKNYIDIIKEKLIEEHELNKLSEIVDRREWFRGLPDNIKADESVNDSKEIKIVSRREWNARRPKCTKRMPLPVGIVFVHHTSGVHGYNRGECGLIVQGVQNLHMDGCGWDDIAYNFLIGEDGYVYEGRGWDKVGAHTLHWNDKSISFAFLGDFNNKRPNLISLKTLERVIAYGVRHGKISKDYTLFGHRDKRPTDGPGHYLYAAIKHFDHFHYPIPSQPKNYKNNIIFYLSRCLHSSVTLCNVFWFVLFVLTVLYYNL